MSISTRSSPKTCSSGSLLAKAAVIAFLFALFATAFVLWNAGWRGVTNPPSSIDEVDMEMATFVAVGSLVIAWVAGTAVAFGALLVHRRMRKGP